MINHYYLDSSLSLMSLPGGAFYQEFRPSADLRDFVACLWVRVVGKAEGAAPAPIIPDGCADIMIYDDEPPCVAGPDAVTRWLSLPEGLVITGIRLRPGAARAVLKCPGNLLVNQSALLSDLVRGASNLHRDLIATDNIRLRQALLETWVRNTISENRYDDRAILAACRTLTADTQKEMDTLAFELGWSARTLHRRFLAACGYGPKHFQRIMRIQLTLRFMHGFSKTSLAEAALESGFADQAHMTRTFRAITGFSPSSYLTLTRPEFGTWIADD